MTLKTATMIAMLAMVFAIAVRFLLTLWSLAQMMSYAQGSDNLGFIAQSLLHFVVDAVAYGALLLFLFVLWSKQQSPSQ